MGYLLTLVIEWCCIWKKIFFFGFGASTQGQACVLSLLLVCLLIKHSGNGIFIWQAFLQFPCPSPLAVATSPPWAFAIF